MAAFLLAGCGGDDAPGATPCGATLTRLTPFAGPGTVAVLDVTGDGVDDDVAVRAAGEGAYALEVGEAGARIVLRDGSAFLVAVGAAELDGDGQRDLLIGLPWLNRALVFRGPVRGELEEADALLMIDGPPVDGGLAPLFGSAVLVADVDLDGARDVVVAAPAEGEEGCLGQLAPRVYLGPFAAGARLTEADADLLLDGPARACLGEELTCTAAGFEASAAGGAVCYSFPLAGPAPTSCAP